MHVAVMAPVSGVPEEGFALMLIHSVFKYYYHISDTVYIFGCLSQFRFLPYVGMVTIIMNDYPKFKVGIYLYVCIFLFFNIGAFTCATVEMQSV